MAFRFSSALWVGAMYALACLPLPASADDALARATNSSIVLPTSAVIRDIMAQAVPVGTAQKPLSMPGLPTGLTYTLDASIAFPYGNTGSSANLPGGVDAVVGFGINKYHRIQAGYYEFQEYPIGFSQGTVPVYLQGLSSPVATANLATQGINVATKDKLFTAVFQNLFLIGGKLPIVVSPTYIARSANVGGPGDLATIQINGFPQAVHQRSNQSYLIALTVPFLSTPRLFGTLTAAPQWNVNLNGANVAPNHAQIFELLYLEYRASKSTTFFVQPSRLIDYLPPDTYAETIPTLLYGVSHKFTKQTFVQITASTGGPSNNRVLGISALTCQSIAANGSCTSATPTVNGLHATQVQIQFGIGSPSVVPL